MEITIKIPDNEQGRKLAALLENPDTLEKLTLLLNKIDEILTLTKNLNKSMAELPGGVGVITDKIDDLAEEYRLQGKDLSEVINKLLDPELIDRLNDGISMLKEMPAMMKAMLIMNVDKIDNIMLKFVEAGVLPEEAGNHSLKLAVASAVALNKVYKDKDYNKIGLFGMMSALRDPNAQKGLGLFIELLKEIGKTVPEK